MGDVNMRIFCRFILEKEFIVVDNGSGNIVCIYNTDVEH